MLPAILFLYVPCRDVAEARKLATALLEEKLIACANILPAMESVYRWEGRIENGQEALLILKTAQALHEKAAVRLKELHSYKVPCIAALDITAMNPEYQNWLLGEIK
jgi:periplasmic divalent cation tolerance protein